MPRRSIASTAAARVRLLRAGRELAASRGLRALTVRGVAQRAEVNLGSFVYHFGTREAFVAQLIEDWYAPFYARLQLADARGAAPLARLRQLVLQVVEFLVANRDFIVHVLMDAAANEAPARRFVQSLGQRHPRLVLKAIRDAQAQGAVVKADPLRVLLFLMGGIALPAVLLGGARGAGLLPREIGPALQAIATDLGAARERLDWALRGIAVKS